MFSGRIGSVTRLASNKYSYCLHFRPISRSRLVVRGVSNGSGSGNGNMDSSTMPPTIGIPDDHVILGFQPPPMASHPVTTDQLTPGSSQKKKARHSKQQKRDRKATQTQPEEGDGNTRTTQEKKQEEMQVPVVPPVPVPAPAPVPAQVPKTPVERILACARNAQFTKSVWMEPPYASSTTSRVHIVTRSSVLSGNEEASRQHQPHDPRCPTLRIQPLLILDLNGILCHRSRRHKEPPGVTLHPFVGSCAGTPIIPRSDLINMLLYLDQHFCLAVWTSAKRKTARRLLDLLLPPAISQRLLFVWTQAECDVLDQPELHKEEEVVFQKFLSKVWRAFPLWNSSNTLLMDDSPAKCPYAVGNAIHPPPIHGQMCSPPKTETETPARVWQSDMRNQQFQAVFYQRLVGHWATSPYERSVESTSLNIIEEQVTNLPLRNFLQEHAIGHMGWRGGDTDLTTINGQADPEGGDSGWQPSVGTASSEATNYKRPTDPRLSSR
jgi:hypothetical protein